MKKKSTLKKEQKDKANPPPLTNSLQMLLEDCRGEGDGYGKRTGFSPRAFSLAFEGFGSSRIRCAGSRLGLLQNRYGSDVVFWQDHLCFAIVSPSKTLSAAVTVRLVFTFHGYPALWANRESCEPMKTVITSNMRYGHWFAEIRLP